MHYVYELINFYGTIEYVGVTKRPYIRWTQHVKAKPGIDGHGKFHGRSDLIMHLVEGFEIRKMALKLEENLKIQYNLPVTERMKGRKDAIEWGKLYGKKNVENGILEKAREAGKAKRHTCPRCGETRNGAQWLGHHIRKGTATCPIAIGDI